MRDLLKQDVLLWLVVFTTALIGAFRYLLFTQWFAPSAVRCRTALLLLRFLIVGIHASGISIPLSLLMLFFAPARVVIRVTINKLYFVPEWLVSSVAGRLWNDGGLSTGESNVSIVLLNSVLRSSSSLSDVHLAASTGNPVNYAIWIDRDPYYYPRSVKEAIYIRLHPSNINRDSGLEIPEAWMLTEQSAVKNSTPQLPCQYLISLWLHSVYWVERRKSVANVTGRRFLCTYSSLVALLKTDPVYHV